MEVFDNMEESVLLAVKNFRISVNFSHDTIPDMSSLISETFQFNL